MVNKIFILPQIYPVLPSLVCLAIVLLGYLVSHVRPVLSTQACHQADEDPDHTILLYRPPQLTHHLHGTWFLGIPFLFSLTTQYALCLAG